MLFRSILFFQMYYQSTFFLNLKNKVKIYDFLVLIRKFTASGELNFDYRHFFEPLKSNFMKRKVTFKVWDINCELGIFAILRFINLFYRDQFKFIMLNSWSDKNLSLNNPSWKLLNRLCEKFDKRIIFIDRKSTRLNSSH